MVTDINKYKWLIGIDPGVKTGFALYDVSRKGFLMIETICIIRAFNYLQQHEDKRKMFVRVEDARKRKWFGDNANKIQVLQGVGSVKRETAIWESFLEFHGIDFEMVDPKRNKTKLDAQLFSKYTGWKLQTSEHGRDAAMLVYGY